METKIERQFIAVVPEKSEEEKISRNKEIERYIFKTIVSKPNQELLRKVNDIIEKNNIAGILTRGSLAHFLFNNVPIPIFDLKFDLTTLFKTLEECYLEGYRKICIFEIGYDNTGTYSQNIFTHNDLGDYEIYYFKMYNYIEIESKISELTYKNCIDVLIGDVEPARIANKYNIPIKQIHIDEHSWYDTINMARHSSDLAMKAKSKNNFIEIITNIVSEAVIITDDAGIIKRYNMQAERLFFKEKEHRNISSVFNNSIEELLEADANNMIKVSDNNYIINIIPVILENEQLHAIIINNVKYVESLEMSIRTQNKEKGLSAKYYFKNIIYMDSKTKKIVETSKKYARSNGTVIIYGESGTGKEVFASSIHNESLRSNGPFVAINCASFNENLIESELFGYEKGSFTGALNTGKKGLFEIAHNGTLFLDEIGDLPLNLQAKLLRVIQEKEILRIGGNKVIPVDLRIIAATNKNLKKMVKDNSFREDLYYRLALLEIELPPLRKRLNDIVPLFIAFITEIAEQEKKSLYWENSSVFKPLLSYDWPGNIRELRNFAERIVIVADKNKINELFIKEMIEQKNEDYDIQVYSTNITNSLHELESNYIKYLMNKFGNDRDKLCDYLGISKTTLWRKLNNP